MENKTDKRVGQTAPLVHRNLSRVSEYRFGILVMLGLDYRNAL